MLQQISEIWMVPEWNQFIYYSKWLMIKWILLIAYIWALCDSSNIHYYIVWPIDIISKRKIKNFNEIYHNLINRSIKFELVLKKQRRQIEFTPIFLFIIKYELQTWEVTNYLNKWLDNSIITNSLAVKK